MAIFRQDILFTWRLLRSNPGFTIVVTLILGLGIGASSTVFSIVDELLLRPLPYKEPQRIVALWDMQHQGGELVRHQVTYQNFVDWHAQSRAFEEMAAMAYGDANFSGAGESKRVSGLSVTEGYFRVLGIGPALGRTFLAEECASDANRAVILSYGFWQKYLGGRSDVIGQIIRLDGYRSTIVGVMPAEYSGLFTFMGYKYDPEMWTPLTPKPWQADRGNHSWFTIARLRAGISIERAQAEMDTISSRLQKQYPGVNTGWSVLVVRLQESLFGSTRPTLLSLAGAVGFVLLIACVNVANLLLGRSLGRGKEIAIRIALGAGRLRIMRQLLTEGLALSLLGGAAGLLMAEWGIDFVNSFVTGGRFTITKIRMDLHVVSFSFLAAGLVAVLVGLVPALRASRINLNLSLKEGARSASVGHGQSRLGHALVISEVMLSLVLLTGAGLLVKSFIHLWHVNLGFRPEPVLTMSLVLSEARRPESSQVVAFYRQLLDRVGAIQGVDSTGITSRLPLEGSPGTRIMTDGQAQLPPWQWPVAGYLQVSPGYFSALGIPLERGRSFTSQDDEGSPRVAIISAGLARKYWGDQDPVGKRLWHTASGKTACTVIGVAADHRQE
ncbi:MAG TPA: ABC transporter permease, partial [Acidobacteriota bacterium]|nr:ABC transporter permease [Acidobacteriota bacterium]